MTAVRNLTAVLVVGALIAGGSAAFSQTQGSTAQPMRPQTSPEMREMMRDMMRDMMQQERTNPRASDDDDDTDFRRGWGRGRDGHWGSMMGGPSGKMRRGFMHGPGLAIAMAVMDTDGDGGVSLEEVQAFHARMFSVVDGNADGQLTKEEVQEFFRGTDQ